MKKVALSAVLISVAALFGCSSKAPPTQASILAALQAKGVQVSDVQNPPRDPSSPLPNSYKEHFSFALPSVAPKGGQVFICAEKSHCDAIYAYFDALKALAGPYLYRSKDGLVVAQLNSGLTPDAAVKIGNVIDGI